MKQGLKFKMGLRFKMSLDLVEHIEIKIQQGDIVREITYPSEEAVRSSEHIISVLWSAGQTYKYKQGRDVEIDTRITLKDSQDQPETKISRVKFNRTLFEEVTE